MAMSLDAGRQLPLLVEHDTPASWTIRRSARARRLSARVHLDGRVDIVVPQRTAARHIEDFVTRHRLWIESKVALACVAAPHTAAFPPASLELPAFGEFWRVHLAGGSGAPRVRSQGKGLVVVRGRLEEGPKLAQALQRWLLAHARPRLGAMLASEALSHGFRYRHYSLRRQRTRWGSCSARGTISLNVCLAFQVPEVVRYLLVHELSHTLHMNHSAKFWECVARCVPHWQGLDRQLVQGWRNVPRWVFV